MPPSFKSRLLAGGIWVLVGKFATAGSSLLALALLARLLTRESFAVYGLAFSVVMTGSVVAQFGLHLAVVRFVAEAMGTGRPARAHGAVRLAYRWCLYGYLGAAAILLLGGGARLAALWESPRLAGSLVGVSLWLVLNGLQVLNSETFRGFQDLKRSTLYGGVVSGIVMLALLAALWLAGIEIGLSQAIAIGAGTTGLSVVLGVVALRSRLGELGPPEPPAMREMLGVGLPLWVSGILANVLGQVDLWVLGAYLPKDDVAVYVAAFRLVNLVSMSLLLVNLLVPPFIAELYFTGDRARLQRLLRQAATLAGIPAVGVLASFVLFGGPILGAFGTEYREGALVLTLLTIGRVINVLTGSCSMTLAMTGHQRTQMVLTIFAAALTVVGALWVVKPYGTVGMAVVSSVAVSAYNVALVLAAKYHTGLWTHVGWVRPRDVRALFAPAR